MTSYMRKIYKTCFICLICILILTSMIILFFRCIGGGNAIELVIENQTTQVLTIYYKYNKIGDTLPGQQISISTDANIGNYPIKALNTQGEVVFEEVFSFTTNLEKMNNRKYKGIIPPLE